MNLQKMAFELIERLIKEGNFVLAAFNLLAIARKNRLKKLIEELEILHADARYLEVIPSADEMHRTFIEASKLNLIQDLTDKVSILKGKETLKIPVSVKHTQFIYRFNEEDLSKKEKEIVYNRIATIKSLGFDVEVNRAQ